MTREQFQELFQSTLPVGGATDFYKPVFANLGISIHAPRGGSDCHSFGRLCSASYFNPRSPWGERLALTTVFSRSAPFQSTLPVGGATRDKLSTLKDRVISIHAPRGGSDSKNRIRAADQQYFNPRSPWGERQPRRSALLISQAFQSTLPVGGATGPATIQGLLRRFQSTLPVGGATPFVEHSDEAAEHFNPRSPWGERLSDRALRARISNFNPRSPWGERLSPARLRSSTARISIHAPRGGSDCDTRSIVSMDRDFNPRSPWGERRKTHVVGNRANIFQSTLPVGGATDKVKHANRRPGFQSTLPVGGATLT